MAGYEGMEYERDYPRENMRAKAQLSVDGEWHDGMIVNISSSGVKLNLGLRVVRGKDVVVKLGDFGDFNATVAWSQGGEIGLRFNHDPEEMTTVIIGMASYG